MLIALNGYASAGKDTLGSVLMAQHGFKRVAFADALKRFALRMDPVLEVEPDLDTAPYKAKLSQIVELYGGLEQAKSLPAVRAYLQHLGLEARQTFGKDAWVKAARLDEALEEHGHVVVTDCRFRNEAQAVRDLGGKVVRITRPGITAVNAHISEHDLDEWRFDATVNNAGTILDLHAQAASLLREWKQEAA